MNQAESTNAATTSAILKSVERIGVLFLFHFNARFFANTLSQRTIWIL